MSNKVTKNKRQNS